MLELTTLDFVLFCSLCYMLGIVSGLTICCHWKETFLQRQSERDHHPMPPEPVVVASAPPVAHVTFK